VAHALREVIANALDDRTAKPLKELA